MHTVYFLRELVANHTILTFVIIYLGIIIEGEFILIVAGILTHLGAIDFGTALFFIVAGGLSKSFAGYGLGMLLRRMLGEHKFFKYISRRIRQLLPDFKRKPFWSLFISKFMIGTNNIAMIFSGYERVNFKKYLRAEVSSTLIWAPALLTLGYLFGYTALRVSNGIWKFIVVVIVLFTIFVLFDKLVTWLYELFEEFYEEQQ